MSVTSNRSIVINQSGDITYQQTFAAAVNPAGSAQDQLVSVTTALTVTVPSGATAVNIIPPVGNTVGITIKGITGDTGIGLGKTDPSSFALSTTQATFILAAASTISGVRLIWS